MLQVGPPGKEILGDQKSISLANMPWLIYYMIMHFCILYVTCKEKKASEKVT